MKYVIVYWSRYGNGKRVVEALAGKLNAKGHATELLTTDTANPKSLPEADLYVFSAPAEAFNLQRNMRKFMKQLTGVSGKRYGIINTHGMKKKNWLGKMAKLLNKKRMKKVAALDYQVGKNADSGNALPSGWEAKLDAFAAKLM